jgi:hypothetical protein
MFESTSRYYTLETATYERESDASDGPTEIAYVRRRFLPQGGDLPLLVEATVEDGDRLDLITARTLGDPEQFWRVCDANNAMRPEDLTEETGRTLRVPVPQYEEPR